ncbi:MAG: hypothetical protein JXD23_00730 [Spirochaetales bacterium]|nr:hypothetical protein [Spirochaetales bacterium]
MSARAEERRAQLSTASENREPADSTIPPDTERPEHPEAAADSGCSAGLFFQAEAAWNPFAYNAFENSHGDGLDLSVSLGLPVGPVRLGGTLSYHYRSFDTFDAGVIFNGA